MSSIPKASPHDIPEALKHLSPDCPHDEWVRYGMAIHSELGDAGFEIWDNWSSAGKTYNPQDTKAAWNSFNSGGGITIASLFEPAIKNGYKRRTNGQAYKPIPWPPKPKETPEQATLRCQKDTERLERIRSELNKAKPCKNHKYTHSKGVAPKNALELNGNLILPLRNVKDKNIGAEVITPGGKKRCLPGSMKAGSYFVIGASIDNTVVIVEGYSTGLSLNEATGHCVLVAFGKGNIAKVTHDIREARPDLKIVVSPDHDQNRDAINISIDTALKYDCEVAHPESIGDWNDLHQSAGLDEVKKQFENNRCNPAPTEPQPEPEHSLYSQLGSELQPVSQRVATLNHDSLPIPLYQENRCHPCTDTANAQRFAKYYGRDVINLNGIGWFRFNDSYWEPAEHYVQRCALELGIKIRKESYDCSMVAGDMSQSAKNRNAAHKESEALLSFAKRSESGAAIAAIMKLAPAYMSRLPAEMDTDRWLLNCPNGTVDLKTGTLQPARQSDLITQSTHVAYDSNANYDLWKQTVLAVCCGDTGLMQYLQRLFGYCLTGLVNEQVMFIFNGSGANGKDTLLGRVSNAMGDYAGLAAPSLLMASRGDRHPTEMADLFGTRMAIASETNENGKLNEVLVKQLTGSEKIKARKMRQDFFEFPALFKIILMTNHRPVIEGSDYAIWRRIHLVPFNATFKKGGNRDDTLQDRLDELLPGILRWCVEGCLEWQRIGLQPPEAVTNATKQYKADQDVLSQFIDERCVIKPPTQVTAKALYLAYETWCSENGERPKSQKWLWPKLQEKGISKDRTVTGFIYRGIGLRDTSNEEF